MSVGILFVVALVVVLVLAIAAARLAPRNSGGEYAYTAADTLLTHGELAFHKVLKTVTPPRVCINSKVRLADIIQVPQATSRPRWAAAFNKIVSKHVDFVLCDSDSLKILCVIELHDKSHNTQKRAVRDTFVRQAMASASVPYIEVKASAAYNASELRDRLDEALSGSKRQTKKAQVPDSALA